jgi:hypothetical protein
MVAVIFAILLASSLVLPKPKLNRTADDTLSEEIFMADKTCEGFKEPEVHADPPEAETPAKSRFMSMLSDEMPGKLKFRMCGSRSSG